MTNHWSSSWFGFEIGLFQGCTASTINFDVAFQPLLDIVNALAWQATLGTIVKEANFRVPPLVYADDVEFLTSTITQNSNYLNSSNCIRMVPQCKQILPKKKKKCRSFGIQVV
jgi:hypothetical protein